MSRLAAFLLILAVPPLHGQPLPAPPGTGGGLVIDVLLDTSSTVKGEDLSAARRLVLDLFDELPHGSRIGVVTFGSHRAQLLEPTSDRQALEAALFEAHPTKDAQDLVRVLSAARSPEHGAGRHRPMLLFTNGVSLPLPSKRPGSPLAKLLDGVRAGGAPILVIDTRQLRPTELRALAEESGGEYDTLDEAKGFLLARTLAGLGERPALSSEVSGNGLRPSDQTSPSDREARSTGAASLSGGARASAPSWIWLAAAGLALLVGGCLLGLRLARRSQSSARPPQPQAPATRRPVIRPVFEPPAPAGATSLSPLPVAPPQAPPPKGKLRLAKGKGEGNLFSLSPAGATLVGRGEHAHIRIVDPLVGAEHFRIVPTAGGLTLRALGDDLPTSVNGSRVREHLLSPGDLIAIGNTQLEYLAG